jgi:hypothetical protein
VNVGDSAPPIDGQTLVATTHGAGGIAEFAEWGSPPPLLRATGATLQRNQWMFSSQAGGAVTAPVANVGDAFGVYFDGAFTATVTAGSFQSIISPEGVERDQVSPPSSITLNSNHYYEWVLSPGLTWFPRIIPPSPFFPFRFSAKLVSTAPIILSGAQTIDGITTGSGDRVLVAGQATAKDNGVYYTTLGAWRRAADADRSAMFNAGMIIPVIDGLPANRGLWALAPAPPIVLGTTSLVFTKISV